MEIRKEGTPTPEKGILQDDRRLRNSLRQQSPDGQRKLNDQEIVIVEVRSPEDLNADVDGAELLHAQSETPAPSNRLPGRKALFDLNDAVTV